MDRYTMTNYTLVILTVWQVERTQLTMRCSYTKVSRDIHFDRARYQQFLREQGLCEHDINYLNIHFIHDFTLSQLRGSEELRAGGAFFQRGEEYVAKMNETASAFYRPVNPDNQYAAIFFSPTVVNG
jgi:hypothetical protein